MQWNISHYYGAAGWILIQGRQYYYLKNAIPNQLESYHIEVIMVQPDYKHVG
jgi:hypothetical protein